LEVIFAELKITCSISTFSSADELLDNIKKVDIGILDVVMNQHNGIELGRRLKEKFPDIRLIYTTSYEQYVMQAINDVHAYSYLCKPLKLENMRTQIVGLLDGFSKKKIEKEFYNVIDSKKREYAVVKLRLEDIIYFVYIKRKRKISIFLKDEIYEYDCTFENIVKEFERFDFAVNCRGNLVNLSHAVKIKGYTLFLDNGMELSISQRRISDFRTALNNFLQKRS
jgi:DNA-binding LytR/AlgR family response regulator